MKNKCCNCGKELERGYSPRCKKCVDRNPKRQLIVLNKEQKRSIARIKRKPTLKERIKQHEEMYGGKRIFKKIRGERRGG